MGDSFLNHKLPLRLFLFLELFSISVIAISLMNEERGTGTEYLVPRNLKIISLTPGQLQFSKTTQIKIIIDKMPRLKADFHCVFSLGNLFFETRALRTENGVNCSTPKEFSKIEKGQNFANWKLSVRIADLASTNFTVFDCSTYKICSECIFSGFPCEWSREDIKCGYCSQNSNGKCITDASNNKVLTAENVKIGPLMCPSITIDDPIILVPSGMTKAVKVNVQISEDFLVQARFRCRFDLEGQNLEVEAILLGDTIYCSEVEFSYESKVPKVSVPFFLLAGRADFHFENPKNISIEIFKCEEMGKDCNSCVAVEEKYNCRWCENTNRCESRNYCEGSWKTKKYFCDQLDSNVTRSIE